MQNRMRQHGLAPPNTRQHQQPPEVLTEGSRVPQNFGAAGMCSPTPVSHISLRLQSAQFNSYWGNKQNLTKHPPHFALKWRKYGEQQVIQEGGQVSSAWTTEETWLDPGQGKSFIYSPGHPDQLWGPPSLLFSGFSGSLPWSNAHHSPPPNVEVKNEGSYTTILTIRLHGMHKGRKQSDCYNLNTNLQKTKDSENTARY